VENEAMARPKKITVGTNESTRPSIPMEAHYDRTSHNSLYRARQSVMSLSAWKHITSCAKPSLVLTDFFGDRSTKPDRDELYWKAFDLVFIIRLSVSPQIF
jgi:hypothetical protein